MKKPNRKRAAWLSSEKLSFVAGGLIEDVVNAALATIPRTNTGGAQSTGDVFNLAQSDLDRVR